MDKGKTSVLNYHKEIPDRCRFIVESSTATRYLNVFGDYLYVQAVKDHFALPFDIPEERKEQKIYFPNLIQELAEHDGAFALKVWHWCLEMFLPYIRYAKDPCEITDRTLLVVDYVEGFLGKISAYMDQTPTFMELLLLGYIGTPYNIPDMTVNAIQSGRIETAKKMVALCLKNQNFSIQTKVDLINSSIDSCSNGDEAETMDLFRIHVFPVIFNESDVRIKNKIARWQKEMDRYMQRFQPKKVYSAPVRTEPVKMPPVSHTSMKNLLRI